VRAQSQCGPPGSRCRRQSAWAMTFPYQ
jgi:hypothetical protein